MQITIEMACSINGMIADKNGDEEFLSNRNYRIMLEFLKDYDCLVWGNTTFKNVLSWGKEYINDLKDKTLIIFSRDKNNSNYENVIYCRSFERFTQICKEHNLNKIFISGGAHINTLFMKNKLVDEIILNYNPYVLNQGVNLFEGDFFQNELILDKVIQEKEGIVQIWYKVKK